MNDDGAAFLRDFYRALEEHPLEPDDAQYQPLYADKALSSADPVQQLERGITWSRGESVQLFSGFRGTGKSTELRRLRQRLQAAGYKVVLCDMQDHLNLSTPVDVSDFLVSLAGAFSEALASDPDLLGEDVGHRGYWTRFADWMTRTRVSLDEVGLSAKGDAAVAEVGASVKLNLKQDPTFREVLQQRLKGHLGALVQDVHGFMAECVKAVRREHGEETQVVLLLDSIEQIRGTAVNAQQVFASVETLFHGHADKLRFQELHVVYTVPPWLKIQAAGATGLFDGAHMVPCVKVRDREQQQVQAGLDAVATLVGRRADWARLLGDRTVMDKLTLASGGFLRDLFRLLKALLLQADPAGLPVSAGAVDRAIAHVRSQYLPLPEDDACWLAKVDRTGEAGLPSGGDLARLSRFYENALVLGYRNGEEWYGVHPLVREHVRAVAERVAGERAERGDDPPSEG